MNDFYLRVMSIFAFDNTDLLWWRTDSEYAPITFFVNANDLMDWGSSDLEQITPENIDILEQSLLDCNPDYKTDFKFNYGLELFVCRVRKERPQGAAYPKDETLWPLFDACGPERVVRMGNPMPHPSVQREQEKAKEKQS